VPRPLGPPLLLGGLVQLQPGFFDPLLGSPFGMLILIGAGARGLVVTVAAAVMIGALVVFMRRKDNRASHDPYDRRSLDD